MIEKIANRVADAFASRSTTHVGDYAREIAEIAASVIPVEHLQGGPVKRGQRVEVGADGCGCPITEEILPNCTSIEGTERTDHLSECVVARKEQDL